MTSNFNKYKQILFILLFIATGSIFATDYYCDPINGKISNLGDKANPWNSLESVFKAQKQFQHGDVIYLLAGNHGNVTIVGENAKYIKIIGIDKENTHIKSLSFGTNITKASKWIVSNVNVHHDNLKENLIYIHKNSSKIRLISNTIYSENKNKIGILIKGSYCKVEHNFIYNITKAIEIVNVKNHIRNNRIAYFSENAIELSSSYNVVEYNLIKENISKNTNSAIQIHSNPIKGIIIRGNTMINFIKLRKNISIMHGVFGKNVNLSESILENNSIISNGVSGISLKGIINNTKIVNNTIVNPYFGLEFNDSKTINTQLSIKINGTSQSSNVVIQNNLVNNLTIENINGIVDHNMVIPVDIHRYDTCFNHWALFDFSLSINSKAINKGSIEFAPKWDAVLNKRPLGSLVNIGAYEFNKVNEANDIYVISAEKTDRQIHSKGKSDWDGQPKIRVGGSGEGIDGAGVFPFKLPVIQGGKELISANFIVNLHSIDNSPSGSVSVYGLPPKSNFWVTDDMFYQGMYGQDLKARPIQNEFVDANTITGRTELDIKGKIGLKNYLKVLYENGTKAGNYVFIRLNPTSKNVTDYHRWSFISGNTNKENKKPKLELIVGYPELNNKKSIKKSMIFARPNPISNGDFSLHFFNFDDNNNNEVILFSKKGKEVFRKNITVQDLKNNIYRSENLALPIGKYFIQYAGLKKTPIFIR